MSSWELPQVCKDAIAAAGDCLEATGHVLVCTVFIKLTVAGAMFGVAHDQRMKATDAIKIRELVAEMLKMRKDGAK